MNPSPIGMGKMNKWLLRLLDVVLALTGMVLTLPLLLLIALIGLLDHGSPLFFQERVGRLQKPFILVKFRTMKRGTASAATHLTSASAVTPLGRFLRSSKLDELPQLWNVLTGDMSLVGPRPCLMSQQELIAQRAVLGVFDVRPGVTGLAQIHGVDMSMPKRLAEMDAEMIKNLDFKKYFCCIVMTVLGRGRGDGVKLE